MPGGKEFDIDRFRLLKALDRNVHRGGDPAGCHWCGGPCGREYVVVVDRRRYGVCARCAGGGHQRIYDCGSKAGKTSR